MADYLQNSDKRTAYCAQLTKDQIGERVCVMGWVQKQRNLGALIFIDLRDRSGIIQLSFDEQTNPDIFRMAYGIRSEYVLCAKGVVRSRGEGAINKTLPTGEIEVAVDELKILSASHTPPFEIVENSPVRPDVRLRYRFLICRLCSHCSAASGAKTCTLF